MPGRLLWLKQRYVSLRIFLTLRNAVLRFYPIRLTATLDRLSFYYIEVFMDVDPLVTAGSPAIIRMRTSLRYLMKVTQCMVPKRV